MADIFISYSSNDREQAELLTELLASAGLSVWIDTSDLAAATSWSAAIVDAINGCKVLIALLSASSIASHNVIKEVSLASEKRKKILPLDLEPVALPRELEYQLAGIQRAPMSNIDAIIRALAKLGLEATGAPQAPTIVKAQSNKKSLMILPFEDLSPTGDNGWFADGIVSELISALSHIKSLRITDAQETKAFKSFKGHLNTYAREMSIRFFVQGDVRKFGDQIKISARLLDIETGDHLWQESIKGTMADVFAIQEQVAQRVVGGLKLHLTPDEQQKLAAHETANAEAYELSLKANEYAQRQTREGLEHAVQLLSEAIALDAGYANAYQLKATALAGIYRNYDRNPGLLVEAESLCKEALRLKPDLFGTYQALSMVYMHQGKMEQAEAAAKTYVRMAPDDNMSHFALGFFYMETGQNANAIAPYKRAVELKPDDRVNLFNLAISCRLAKEFEHCKQWSLIALTQEARHLKLHPDDEGSRKRYASLLFFSGRPEDALREINLLKNAKDGLSLFQTACLFGMMGEKQEAIVTLRKAIEAGFKNTRLLTGFLADEDYNIAALRGTTEHDAVLRMVEKISEA